MSSEQTAMPTGIVFCDGTARSAEFPQMQRSGLQEASASMLKLFDTVQPEDIRLDKEFVPAAPGQRANAEIVQMSHLPERATSCANAVYFARLLLRECGELSTGIDVAVKVFDDPVVAAREYAITSHFASDTSINCDTFRPVGITKDPDGRVATLTRYDKSIQGMDKVFWNLEAVYNRPVVDAALRQAGKTLASMHEIWSHGDFEARNSAWDMNHRDRLPFVVDLECAESLSGLSRIEQDEARLGDVLDFAESVFLLQNLPNRIHRLDDDLGDRVIEHFGTAYTNQLRLVTGDTSRISPDIINRVVGDIC